MYWCEGTGVEAIQGPSFHRAQPPKRNAMQAIKLHKRHTGAIIFLLSKMQTGNLLVDVLDVKLISGPIKVTDYLIDQLDQLR